VSPKEVAQASPLRQPKDLTLYLERTVERILQLQNFLTSLYDKGAINYAVLQALSKELGGNFGILESPDEKFIEKYDKISNFMLETCSSEKKLIECFRCDKRLPEPIILDVRLGEVPKQVCYLCFNHDLKDPDNCAEDYISTSYQQQMRFQGANIEIQCGICKTAKKIEDYCNLKCEAHLPVCNECLEIHSKNESCPLQSCNRQFLKEETQKLTSYNIRLCSICKKFKRRASLNRCANHCSICKDCQLAALQDKANRFVKPFKYDCMTCFEPLNREDYQGVNFPVENPLVPVEPVNVPHEEHKQAPEQELQDNENYEINCPVCNFKHQTNYRAWKIDCRCGHTFCLVCNERAWHKCNGHKVQEYRNRLNSSGLNLNLYSTCPQCHLPNYVGENDVFVCKNCKVHYCKHCCVDIAVVDVHKSKALHRTNCKVRMQKDLEPHQYSDGCIMCLRNPDQEAKTPCVVKPNLEVEGWLNEDELD